MADGGELGEPGRAMGWTAPPSYQLLERARRLPPPWGAADRLAVASLLLMITGLVLPWGSTFWEGNDLPLMQASGPGGVLTGTLVATVVVSAWAARRRRAANRAVTTAMASAGALTAVLALWIHVDRRTLGPMLAPGRVATIVGGTGLAVAAVALARHAARQQWPLLLPPQHAGHGRPGPRPTSVPIDAPPSVAPPPRRSWGFGLATGLTGLAALTLLGAWWRSPSPLHGPWSEGPGPRSVLDVGQSAGLVRSGIDVAGDGRAWAVGIALLLVLVAAVARGARWALPAVAAAGAVVAVVGAGGATGPQADRSALPWLATAGGAAAVVAATWSWWSRAAGGARLAPALWVVVALGVPLVVDGPAGPATIEADGPFQVLAGGAAEDSVVAADTTGAPADELWAVRAMWSDGEPVALTEGSDAVVAWTLGNGLMHVQGIATGHLDYHNTDGLANGTTLIGFIGSDTPPALWTVGEEPRPLALPDGLAVESASLGPDGYLWVEERDPAREFGEEGEPTLRVATPEDLDTDAEAARPLEEWTEVPAASQLAATQWGDLAQGSANGALVVVDEGDADRLVLVGLDGSIRPILGRADDEACGLNRSATGSSVPPAAVEIDAELVPEWDDSHVDLMPLDDAVPAPDGGVWLIMPATDPRGDRVHNLGRVDPDGTLRRVDHALPPITSLAPSPDGNSVLVTDWRGRLLELTDPDNHAEPLPPPPEGCDPEA